MSINERHQNFRSKVHAKIVESENRLSTDVGRLAVGILSLAASPVAIPLVMHHKNLPFKEARDTVLSARDMVDSELLKWFGRSVLVLPLAIALGHTDPQLSGQVPVPPAIH